MSLQEPPLCPYFGTCGGCSFPSGSYEASLMFKENHLLSLFSTLDPDCTRFHGIVRATQLEAFRNKMEFSFFQTVDGNKSLGLMSKSKPRQVVPITSCFVAGDSFMGCLSTVRSWWDAHPEVSAYFAPKNKGSLISLTIRKSNVSGDLLVILTSSGATEYKLSEHHLQSLIDALLANTLPITSIVWEEKHAQKGAPTFFSQRILHGEGFLWQKLPAASGSRELLFKVYAKSFFQPNPKQAAFIPQIIADFIQPTGVEYALDLFCGAGTLGICLSDSVKKIQGVEIVPDAVASAQENIYINHLEDKVHVSLGDAKTFCRSLTTPNNNTVVQKPDFVIVDPPRCGMQAKTLKYLLRMDVPRIIYVSCNPSTQVEECKILAQAGYRLTAMKAVDQFPYTSHLENIVLMEKSR